MQLRILLTFLKRGFYNILNSNNHNLKKLKDNSNPKKINKMDKLTISFLYTRSSYYSLISQEAVGLAK